MGQLGTIKEVNLSDGVITCKVVTTPPNTITATVYGMAGMDTHPLPGDEVKVSFCNGEYIIDAVFRDNQAGAGETIVYGRDSSGDVVSLVHCKSDGEIESANSKGKWTLKANGQFDANGNFTVDPT